LKYIIEICVALDLAILGIAYPIIINEINKIGDRYKSNYLSELFKTEIPQRQIILPHWLSKIIPSYLSSISRFQFYLILTVASFIFLIANLKPLWGMDFWLINNSAKLIVLLLTIVLVYNFFMWLDMIALYNGKTIDILRHVIDKFKGSNPNTDLYKYSFKTINEFTYYSIRNQDSHIQIELLDFYYEQFDNERKSFVDSIEILPDDDEEAIGRKKKLKERGVEYSSELYDLILTINLEVTNTKNLYVKAIEHQAVSGWWLLGKGYEQIPISKLTYDIIWRILRFSIDNDKLIKQYWSKAHQYFDFGLNYIPKEYESRTTVINNQEEIDFRLKERDKFLEFHYTLGGLLMYMRSYETIKYILTYSSSSPPNYVLLPKNMTQIFDWYEEFRNEFKFRIERIENNYSFPDLDNYGVSYQMKYWVCQFLVVLFVRQFTLRENYIYEDHVGKPNLPDGVIELRNWLDSVKNFRLLLKEILENVELLNALEYKVVKLEKEEAMLQYLDDMVEDINSKIVNIEVNTPLSEEKITNFRDSAERIINASYERYSSVIANYDRDIIYDKLKLTIAGQRDIMDKSAFVEGEIPHFNFDTVTAESVVRNNVDSYLPSSFIHGATDKYLFSINDLLSAIKIAIGNTEDYIIIGVNLSYQFKDRIRENYSEAIFLYCSNRRINNLLYLLDKKDLPTIIKKKPLQEVVEKYSLTPTSETSSIFVSVIDIGLPANEEIRDEWVDVRKDEELTNKVQVMIWMLWLILWRSDRHIIQIAIDSNEEERGVRNDLDDIVPLS